MVLRHFSKVAKRSNATREISPVERNDMIEGKVGPGLNEVSPTEFEPYKIFGKSITLRKERTYENNEEEQKRQRAKRANEIFRKICRSAGLTPFFFDKFLTWSDYVEGKMSEQEFMEKVKEEVSRKAEALKS